jgi:hypothetical protein
MVYEFGELRIVWCLLNLVIALGTSLMVYRDPRCKGSKLARRGGMERGGHSVPVCLKPPEQRASACLQVPMLTCPVRAIRRHQPKEKVRSVPNYWNTCLDQADLAGLRNALGIEGCHILNPEVVVGETGASRLSRQARMILAPHQFVKLIGRDGSARKRRG